MNILLSPLSVLSSWAECLIHPGLGEQNLPAEETGIINFEAL